MLAFTLIELMVVLDIIAMLIAVAAPAYLNSRKVKSSTDFEEIDAASMRFLWTTPFVCLGLLITLNGLLCILFTEHDWPGALLVSAGLVVLVPAFIYGFKLSGKTMQEEAEDDKG